MGTHHQAIDSARYDHPDSGKVFTEVNAADVVLFSSLLLHKTYETTSAAAARGVHIAGLKRKPLPMTLIGKSR